MIEDQENPYEPSNHVPQVHHMSASDFLIFLFFTIGLGFCFGFVFGIWFVS